jgi:hypothetical protein
MLRVKGVRLLTVGLALLASAVLSGCGSTGETKTVVVTTTAPEAAGRAAPKHSKPRGTAKRAAKPKRSLTACDANIRVRRPGTTCAFAQNVFYGFWLSDYEPGVFADSAGIPAYSPAAGKMFTVDCSGARKIVCRANDGGYVTFPMAAISAYTLANAKDYAATHELGDVPPPGGSADPEGPAPREPDDDCDPNYEGACLDPNSVDYDCQGGSGDGPDYTGTVTVVGDDHFGLDRDGDGTACDA